MKGSGLDSGKYRFIGCIGLSALFLLIFIYVFLSLGILVLGLIALPAALLGSAGVLNVITDLSGTALLLISAGVLLLGAGLCAGAGCICPSAFGLYVRFRRTLRIKREKELSEE